MAEPAADAARRTWLRLLRERGAWLVLVLALLTTFASVWNHELWTPDEPREAQIAVEMMEDGFSSMPTLAGEPFVEKPPLYPWAAAASYRLFGVSAGSARIPAALASALAVLAAFLLARRCAGPVAGAAAAVVLLTMSKFASTCSYAINDTALTAAVAGGHVALLAARDAPRRVLPYLGAGACAALAFMAKAWIGPILLFGPPFLALVVTRDWKTLRPALPRVLLLALPPLVLTIAAWVSALAARSSWDVVRECLVNNTFGRTLGSSGREYGSYGHDAPPWDYVTSFPGALLPWALAIPALCVSGALRRAWRGGRTRFVAIVVLAGVLLLSVPSGKRTLYLMPLLPAAAAVFGVWASRVGSRGGGRWDRGTVLAILGTLVAATVVVGVVFVGVGIFGAPNEKLARLTLHSGRLLVAVGVACGGAAVALGLFWWRVRASFDWRAVRAAALVGVATGFLVVLAGRPLLEPMEELRTGALRAAALLSEDRPLVGFDLGETERAVVSFYTRRRMVHTERIGRLDAVLARTGARELVIEGGNRGARHRAELLRRFEVAGRVELKPGDFIEVLRLRDGER